MIHSFEPEQGVGILGAVIFALVSITFHNIIETAVLGAIGAGAGYFTTLFCKWVVMKIKQAINKEKNLSDE